MTTALSIKKVPDFESMGSVSEKAIACTEHQKYLKSKISDPAYKNLTDEIENQWNIIVNQAHLNLDELALEQQS